MDDFKTLDFILKTSDWQFLDFHLRRRDRDGYSPLGYSIGRLIARPKLSLDITRVLLERGATLDDTSQARSRKLWGPYWRQTPLREIAMRSGRADLKELLAEF
jgi:hypothetical protein